MHYFAYCTLLGFEPSAAYVRPILAGARAWSLPPGYVKKLEQIITAAHN